MFIVRSINLEKDNIKTKVYCYIEKCRHQKV